MNAHSSNDALVRTDGDATSAEIVVCVPTFRRPEMLRQTLASLAAQSTPRRFAIVVVENDADRQEGLAVASAFLKSGDLDGVCVVEPEQGNCSAINAAFDTARDTFPAARYFLMIDDDEAASPGWIERMAHAADITGFDIIGGPVIQMFPEGAPRSLARHPAFKPAYERSGRVPVIYGTGNCLIRRRVFENLHDPRFDSQFNFSGGGDTDFFTRARRAGFTFYWTADAKVSETVPVQRTRFAWLTRRGLCIGASNYRIDRKRATGPWGRALLVAKCVAIVPISLVRAMGFCAKGEFRAALHPLNVFLGRLLASIGLLPQQYGPASPTGRVRV